MHVITVGDAEADASCRDTVGGSPFLPPGTSVPRCRICNARMVLFFQFDLRPEFELPFQDRSHLLVFMCPTHNEPPGLPSIYNNSPLPDSYWEADTGHYELLLFPPGELICDGRLDEHIASYSLSFERAHEDVEDFGEFEVGSHDFKIGGVSGYELPHRQTLHLRRGNVVHLPVAGRLRFQADTNGS